MSSSSPIQSGQPSAGVWSYMAQYLASPLAASVAIIPVYPGFVIKSARQLGNSVSEIKFKTAFRDGFKAAPTIGAIVGTQMMVQNIAEKALMALMKYFGNTDKQPSFTCMVISAVLTGAASAPLLAIFNGYTIGQTAMQSLKALSTKQTMAVVARETSFIFSLRISDPVSEAMKSVCGDNKAVEFGSAFASGAIGSLIGHPADTALTRWQKGMGISIKTSMRGACVKAVTLGVFTMCYKVAKDILQPLRISKNGIGLEE